MLVPVVIVGSLVIAVVTVVVVVLLSGRYRMRFNELRAWAGAHGWSFALIEPGLPGDFSGTPVARPVGGYIRNVLRGRIGGAPAIAFDCMVEGQFNDSVQSYAVVAVSVQGPLPPLSVTREGRADRVARGLGFRDIEFENEAFNRQFKVQCAQRAFAYDVLSPRLIEWLLASNGPDWQLAGSQLVLWHFGSVVPAVLEADLAYLEGLLANIPGFIWEKARGSA